LGETDLAMSLWLHAEPYLVLIKEAVGQAEVLMVGDEMTVRLNLGTRAGSKVVTS
jgi:hypothetical protein